jgi:predicted nucleic acid-binding protein
MHAIGAADAFQLAAATVWADGLPRGSVLVTLDKRLAEAARLEGFTVLPEDV